jgi:hypothetical protein
MANIYLPPVVTIPSMLLITNITQSAPIVITFIVPQDGANRYLVGQLVRLTVPKTWGMYQANGLTGKIIQVGATTMSLNIDSSLFDPFIYSPNTGETPASLAPSGSQNLPFSNATRDLPFKSLNNIGN